MKRTKLLHNLQPLLFGCITGVVCGAVIALFLVCSRIVISFAFSVYSLERTPLAIACTLILVILCCLITAVLQTLVPAAKGSGIPLAEGCARGMLKVKWLRTAAALIAGSLLAFTCGMPLGSEGPSIGVGGLIGDGVGRAAKKPVQLRRYLITGGASSGLAVAFNAPLTGVAFALEETHRKFAPGILLAAFSAVVPAIMISQLLFWGFGHIPYLNSLGINYGMTVLPFLAQVKYTSVGALFTVCGVAAASGILCALLAAAFNCCIFLLGKLFGKINNAAIRLLPAFMLTAICGLCIYSVVGSGERTFEHVFDGTFGHATVNTAVGMLILLVVLRFAMTATASGSGATGGLFLPMIAIGGILGTIIAKAAMAMGMSAEYAPNVIMLTISAFFAASVRAPISALAMSVELTASFANLLPCAVAVGIATAIAAILRSAPLYDKMMEDLYNQTVRDNDDVTVKGVVHAKSFICGRRIRDVLWPHNSLVTDLCRDGRDLVPDGETVLQEGDELTVRAELVNKQAFIDQIQDYVITRNRN
ncbi:MAG: chloride channel protein [Clostridiales bacterium]|nr:chloride channel protein [Clostridiales bacterium]